MKSSMNNSASGHPLLEQLLARVLQYGTFLASATIGIGLGFTLLIPHTGLIGVGSFSGARIMSLGIMLFILLPVFRVFIMFLVFLKERDYPFSAIAALVLLILALGFIVGMRGSSGAG